MAALSASRYNPALRAFSNRLADANKKSKVIIVAVMRKMLLVCNCAMYWAPMGQPPCLFAYSLRRIMPSVLTT
jgi:hypothetical protein